MYEMTAGSAAFLQISAYDTPTYSAMRNAAAPITGGMIWPSTPAAVSIAPAFSAVYPTRFISGIVNVPQVTTFATDDPEIIPIIPDETTAAFAGPPRMWPRNANATLMK